MCERNEQNSFELVSSSKREKKLMVNNVVIGRGGVGVEKVKEDMRG